MTQCVTAIFLLFLTVGCVRGDTRCRLDKAKHFLDCWNRALSTIPTENFTADLLVIDLSYNGIEVIENHAFSMLSNLQILDLTANVIVDIKPEAFTGLGNLLALNLSQNLLNFTLEYLPVKLFKPLVSLEEIRIQRCTISEDWINLSLSRLLNLTTLLIDYPEDFIFDFQFKSLTKLRKISTEETQNFDKVKPRHCELTTIQYVTFEALQEIPVKELILVRCKIKLVKKKAFLPLASLEVLDLSFNPSIGLRLALKSLWGLPVTVSAIKMAMVNNYFIGYKLKDSDFRYIGKICVRSVDLSQNYIYYYNERSNPVRFRLDCLEHLNMSYHSLSFWPSGIMSYLSSSERLTHLDFYRIEYSSSKSNSDRETSKECSGPFILPPNLTWLSVRGCQQWFQSCLTVDFTSSSSSLQYLLLDYSVSDNCEFPLASGIPNLTHLDITGIKCRFMDEANFKYLQNITTLIMAHCPYVLDALSARPFELLKNLRHIDLSGNGMMNFELPVFDSTPLTDVNLAHNNFERLPWVVSRISQLQKLDLTFNRISHFQTEEMRLLDSLMSKEGRRFQIMLNGNPLQCTCETVEFILWLFQRKANVDDASSYLCFLANGTRVYLKEFWVELAGFEVQCVSHTYLIISVVGIMTFLVLAVLFFVVYRYRLNLRFWLYTKLMPPENMFVDQVYVYDAFVAYTSKEYKWVIRELRPKLEQVDDPIRLCIHDRDFIPGKPIHENIVEKMKESRKIVLIISTGFLQSRFGPLEIEYAGMKCLEEGREDTILCVLMEDIPVRRMPRALRNLWHKITFLKWSPDLEGQVIFWRNLKSALKANGDMNHVALK